MSREIGMSCWPTGDRRACDEQFNITVDDNCDPIAAYARLEQEAGKAGWCIGHWDGQGYYVCPDHKDSVWNPRSLLAGTR